MHVLMCVGTPIAVAEREERLSEHMAGYTAAEQAQMRIVAVEVLQ